jgi:hypothetical protein
MAFTVRAATPEDHFLEENGKAVGYGLAYKVGDGGYVRHRAGAAVAPDRELRSQGGGIGPSAGAESSDPVTPLELAE